MNFKHKDYKTNGFILFFEIQFLSVARGRGGGWDWGLDWDWGWDWWGPGWAGRAGRLAAGRLAGWLAGRTDGLAGVPNLAPGHPAGALKNGFQKYIV